MRILLLIFAILSFIASAYFWVSACLYIVNEDSEKLGKIRKFFTIICAVPAFTIFINGFIIMAFFM